MFVAPLQIGKVNANEDVGGYGFSIIQISDTQYLSSSYPSSWMQLANWIVANSVSYNIKMVITTGDIVDAMENQLQWVPANDSMSTLLRDGVPYCWDAGNHDQNFTGVSYQGTPNGDWIGSEYLAFNASYMKSQPYWVSDICDSKNAAVQFSYNNYNFLVINLEFHANQTALNWMINLINTHPNYNIIIATHSYLNGMQGYGWPYSVDSPQWENNLTNILNNYPDIFLTMSGHYIHTIYPAGDAETSNYTRINTREETFFNRQMALGDGGPGADSVRIFTFNMTNPNNISVQASTLDIYSGIWKNDVWDSFSFPVNLITATTTTSTPSPSPPPAQSPTPTPTSAPSTAKITSTPKPTATLTPKSTLTPTPKPSASPTPKSTPKSYSTPKPTSSPSRIISSLARTQGFFESILDRLLSILNHT